MIWRDKKRCYLPILQKDKTLKFVEYSEGGELKKNQYGIDEPICLDKQIVAVDLDLVIVPLLAYDAEGNRLGTGGGYYDRTFSFRREATSKKPLLLGLGYAEQQAEHLPADEWDIRLDGVIKI